MDNSHQPQAGEPFTLTAQETLAYQARSLSDATLSATTGYTQRDILALIREDFTRYCERNPQHQRWQVAWVAFARVYAPAANRHAAPAQQTLGFGFFTS